MKSHEDAHMKLHKDAHGKPHKNVLPGYSEGARLEAWDAGGLSDTMIPVFSNKVAKVDVNVVHGNEQNNTELLSEIIGTPPLIKGHNADLDSLNGCGPLVAKVIPSTIYSEGMVLERNLHVK